MNGVVSTRDRVSNRQGSTTYYRAQRLIAIRRDGQACRWCGDTLHHKGHQPWCDLCLTTDHLVPKSKGGTDHHTNLIVACYWCNQNRGKNDRPDPKPTTTLRTTTHAHPMATAVLTW